MRTFFAFVTGAAVGAAVALLLAPEKGEVTRRKIRNAVEDGVDCVTDTARDLGKQAKASVEKIKKEAKEAIDEVNKAARATIKEATAPLK